MRYLSIWRLILAGIILVGLGRAGEAAESKIITVSWASTDRPVTIFQPAGLARGLPVLIALHGSGSNTQDLIATVDLAPVADRARMLVVVPEGTGWTAHSHSLSWNVQFCCGAPQQAGTDDVGFILALIDRLVRDGTADPKRIYLMGFSNGAMLAYDIAARAPDRIAALVAVSGAIGGETRRGPLKRIPQPDRPVPVAIVHGTADTDVPYDGRWQNYQIEIPYLGEWRLPFRWWRWSSVDEALAFWRRTDQCTLPPRVDQLDGYRIERSTPCADGAEVLFWQIDGGGHRWPDRLPDLATRRLIPSMIAITQFLLAHTLMHDEPIAAGP